MSDSVSSWPAYRFIRRQVRWSGTPSLEKFSTVCCDPHSQRLWHSQWSRNRCFFFWNSLAFSMIQWMLENWSLVPLLFLNPAWTSGSSRFMYCWSLAWRIFSITLLACEMSVIVWQFEHSLALPIFGMEMRNWPFPVLWPLLSFPNLLAYWVQHFNSSIF